MGPDYVVGLGRNIIGDIREQLVSKFLGLKKDHIIIMINCELTMEKHNEIFLKSQVTQKQYQNLFFYAGIHNTHKAPSRTCPSPQTNVPKQAESRPYWKDVNAL